MFHKKNTKRMRNTRKRKTKKCPINKQKTSKGVCKRVRGTPSVSILKTPVHLKTSKKTTFKSLLRSIGVKI